ncbi:TetR family transcriptional regulator [Herbidospora galbida]|uniref:TetR family transcriptional regulator n=1 Tax=Herbidospora galbida TaxID=2575442 RepID=A0A4U3ML20_9ACTN|nr:TetR/AcrR family transcriptional regulator [Herbidospora galbida]TKK89224.1 TetR family transcriptional regulator [Herbidospora galbida]
MARWEPNARGRLEDAALDLFTERGYDKTTIAEIAQRAGLTERTFFRHFADKREVLFSGSAHLHDVLVGAVAEAPADAPPLTVVATALERVGSLFEERRSYARRRQAAINANGELLERELVKLAGLAEALDAALRARGTAEGPASVAAETGIALFRSAFTSWIAADDTAGLSEHIRAAFTSLHSLAVASSAK